MQPAIDFASGDASAFQEIVEQAPVAIIFADRDGNIRLWNAAAEAVFGYAANEVLGKNLDVIIPEQFRKAHWSAFDDAMVTGHIKYEGKVLTTRSMHKDGSRLYVDLSFSVLKNASGTIVGALAVARDCTARYLSDKSGQARVKELEAKLQAVPNVGSTPLPGK